MKHLLQFSQNGYTIIRNFVSERLIDSCLLEIEANQSAVVYTDNEERPRRIERILGSGIATESINNIALKELSHIFGDEFTIFKDKLNFKPPMGEGFKCHYDGIFIWKDSEEIEQNGWHKYADEFINVLIALEDSNKENGGLEISQRVDLPFDSLLKHTNNDGTPFIRSEVEALMNFELPDLSKGDCLIFSHKCPHRSSKNLSERGRSILYFTYNRSTYGDSYDSYFTDKQSSTSNTDKSLSSK